MKTVEHQSSLKDVEAIKVVRCTCDNCSTTNKLTPSVLGGGRGHGEAAGAGGAGRDQDMSPELRQAVETAKQDRVEVRNAAPENKAQCEEAARNSEAEVIRLGGNAGMLGEAQHKGIEPFMVAAVAAASC